MAKGPILQKVWGQLPEDRKARIQKRTGELRAEHLTLQELRKKAGLTQVRLSKGLDMPQSNLSRLEQSSDMLLSTLRGYVEAIGGRLNLTVELPDKPPITLVGLGDLIDNPRSTNRSSSHKAQGLIKAKSTGKKSRRSPSSLHS